MESGRAGDRDLLDATEAVPGYTGLERVGGAGHSAVYRAHQQHLGRTVALKVLLLDVHDDHELRRFRRECQLAGRLTGHPNIVTVLDSGTTRSGRPFIAMDYFEHGSLADRLAADGPLPVEEVLRVGVKVAGALAAAHAAGILHRDVKPQNILLSRYGEPALADFGIASLVGGGGPARPDALTLLQAAPEVLEGREPSTASDVYSLGSTLYELLAGHPAYQGAAEDGAARLLLRIASEDPPPLDRAEVPAAVRAAIGRAMARRPEDRFSNALVFAAALRDLQRELGQPNTELVPLPPAVSEPPPLRRPPPAGEGEAPLPALDDTVRRPDRVLRPAPARPRRPPWRALLAGGAAAAVVLGGAGLALRLASASSPHRASAPAPRARPTATARPPATATPAPSPSPTGSGAPAFPAAMLGAWGGQVTQNDAATGLSAYPVSVQLTGQSPSSAGTLQLPGCAFRLQLDRSTPTSVVLTRHRTSGHCTDRVRFFSLTLDASGGLDYSVSGTDAGGNRETVRGVLRRTS